MNEALQVVLTLVGTVGLATLLSALTLTRRLGLRYRFFRFRRSEHIDIILVTSGYEAGGVAGVEYRRPVTSFGTLQAASMFSKAVGDQKMKKAVEVHVSEEIDGRPEFDLVLLGDPTKNVVAEAFLRDFGTVFPDLAIRRPRIGEMGRSLQIGDWEREYHVELQAKSTNIREDLGLIICWINPFTLRKRRAIYCAGFTGWGTSAAAKYLLTDFFDMRYRELRRERKLPGVARRSWPCFVCVVCVEFAAARPVRFKEVFLRTLPDREVNDLLRVREERSENGKS